MAILSKREFREATARRAQIKTALDEKTLLADLGLGLAPLVNDARRRALKTELRRVQTEIETFEELASGSCSTVLETHELGILPILARTFAGMSQRDLAERLGLKEQQIQRYESERYSGISLNRYRRVLDVLGVELTPTFVNSSRDAPSDLDQGSIDQKVLSAVRDRGWVAVTGTSFRDDVGAFLRQSSDLLNGGLLYRRTRKDRANVNPATRLWAARVADVASSQKDVLSGHFDLLDLSWLPELVSLSKFDDGPRQAVRMLAANGVIAVSEMQLPTMALDGSALMLDDGTPVIGLTHRHDRQDNYWFTLLHELGHVFLHSGSYLLGGIFDDLDLSTDEAIEAEADAFAQGILIPDEVWASAPARFSKSADLLKRFAAQRGIGVAIVAGRVRRERNDYRLFSDLVGQGNVRRQLIDHN